MGEKGVIFDLDGTLWDTSTQVVPAWNAILNKHHELNKQITLDEMKSFMGKTIDVIAQIKFPEMNLEKSLEIVKECCNEELIYLRKHGGILYPGLEKTLKILGKRYKLYIVSNCQNGYIQAFLDYHKLREYFKDIEMSGRTGKTKGENIKDIIERNHIVKTVYVGDTIGDFEGANHAGIPFIYAKYGFGKLDDMKYVINHITELNEIIDDILG